MKPKEKWGVYCEIYGINPRNRILEFFLEMRPLDYSMGDVAKETGLNRTTTYETIYELMREGYITTSRKISGSQLYKLNIQSKEVQLLIKTFNTVLDKVVKKYSEKKIYA